MKRAAFFDAGHTLLRAHPSIGAIYSAETTKLGADVTTEQFESVFRVVFKEFWPEWTRDPANRRTSDEKDATMWREITRRIYEKLPALGGLEFEPWFLALHNRFSEPDVWRFYPDAIPTLKALRKRGYKLGIVSNWDSRLRRITVEMGLTDLVDFVLISAEVGVRKPDPEIFQHGLERVGVEAKDTFHVGDLYEEDIIGANEAGIYPVLIDRANRGAPPSDFDMQVVSSLSEVVTWLDR